MKKRSVVYLCFLSALVIAGFVACDNPFSSGSSSGSSSAAPTAADALRAIPVPGEVVGMQSGAGATGLSAMTIRALNGINLWDEDYWEGMCDNGEFDDEVCIIFEGWVGDFRGSDFFLSTLRALATQEADTLQLNEPNRLSGISGAFLSGVFDPEPAPEAVDAGVILITPASGSVYIKWVFTDDGLFGGEIAEDSPVYHFSIDLIGWPGTITAAEIWSLEDYAEANYAAGDNTLRWEFYDIDVTNRSVNKYVIVPPEDNGIREKHENMIFRGTDFGIEAIVSLDEAKEEDQGEHYILSFIVDEDEDFTAFARTDFTPSGTTFLNELDPEDPAIITILDHNDSFSSDGTWGVSDAPVGAISLHGRDNLGVSSGGDINDRVTRLIERSSDLYSIWLDFSMPALGERPQLDDFPALE